MQMLKTSYYSTLSMTIICFILSMLTVMVSPNFHFVWVGLGIVTVILWAVIHYRSGKSAVRTVSFSLVILFFIVCTDFIAIMINLRDRHSEYTSPSGETTIIIEYDFVGRPFMYRKHNKLFMSKIPVDFGPGYNECVVHSVLWLSENEVQLEDYLGSVWVVDIL